MYIYIPIKKKKSTLFISYFLICHLLKVVLALPFKKNNFLQLGNL